MGNRGSKLSGENFLQPDEEQIRIQIQGCLDSYSHPWDLLSELAQKQRRRDSLANRTRGHFTVTVDAVQRTISVTDNGCGISQRDIVKFLRPFGTNKRGKKNQVGEKGVGLTFVIFSSDDFLIVSHHENESCAKKIVGARSWLENMSASLTLQDAPEKSIDVGTLVTIRISEDHSLFDLTFDQVLFVLRTKTAFGDSGHIWDEPLNADVLLKHVDRGGKTQEIEFDCKFLLPIEPTKEADRF